MTDGKVARVSGPVVTATGLENAKMFDVVRVGELGLVGEVIRLQGSDATIQIYEDTTGIKPGDKVVSTGFALSVELGPGLLSSIYDGIQRPLNVLREKSGDFISRGLVIPPLDESKKWEFIPSKKKGDRVAGGEELGRVEETPLVPHLIMVPPQLSGQLKELNEGRFTIREPIGVLSTSEGDKELFLSQRWTVRTPRPILRKLPPDEPLLTGQRVFDTFFPVAKGGTAAIPGPFGSGKCVPGDTPVLLSDGTLVPIEEIYRRAPKEGRVGVGAYEELVPIEGLEVVSFNGERFENRKVSHVFKGKTNGLLRITTSSNKVVTVTPIHKLFRMSEEGRLDECMAWRLTPGDLLAVPSKIPVNGDYQYFQVEPEGGKSSTSTSESGDDISPTSTTFILDESTAESLGRVCSSVTSTELSNIQVEIKEGTVSEEVLAKLMKSPISVVKAFLKGIVESYEDNISRLEYSGEHSGLFAYLLGRVGVRCTVKPSGAGRDSIIVDDISSLMHLIYGTIEHSSFKNNLSRGSSTILETSTGLYLETHSLNGLLEPSIAEWVDFEPVKSVEFIPGEKTVYDITVPETHNFVGGIVPALLHNTVSQQQLAKWSDSRVIVYVGCGERGNEMTEVLTTFPELEDPRSKRPLIERTILVANTSNMPVAAREASIYTGITIAEYYRDMGYDVALMADSTSRWAEALREISGRLEEMPGEEGYPAYLGRRLAEFYERAGKVTVYCPEQRVGSVTVVGAVSPPGGDFSEPVSQNTLRVTRVFWALDASLASRRHFPSINWLTSYSLYTDDLRSWYQKNVAVEWPDLRRDALEILQKEAELQDIVQLVGYDALPESEKGVMDVARMIREDYLQQSAFDPVDAYTSINKQYQMLNTILDFGKMEANAIKAGVLASRIASLPCKSKISRMKWTPEEQFAQLVAEIRSDMEQQFREVVQEVAA